MWSGSTTAWHLLSALFQHVFRRQHAYEDAKMITLYEGNFYTSICPAFSALTMPDRFAEACIEFGLKISLENTKILIQKTYKPNLVKDRTPLENVHSEPHLPVYR